jgi:hypothetical protein
MLAGLGAGAGAAATAGIYSSKVPFGQPFPSLPEGAIDPLILNDAGEFEPTRVAKHLILKDQPSDALYSVLRGELSAAQSAGQPVVAHGIRWAGKALPKTGLRSLWIKIGLSLILPTALIGVARERAGAQ